MKSLDKRNSTFELLRIIAMFMIVYEHGLLATSLNNYDTLSNMDNVSWLLEAFCVCAVNIFFLLTGYFLKNESINYKKIIILWLRIFIYSVLIYSIFILYGIINFSTSDLISYLFPITYDKYWFMQVYLALMLLSPFVLKLLNMLDDKKHLSLICILVLLFSVHETFISVANTLDQTQGYGILWALTLFVIGNYIYKYKEKHKLLNLKSYVYLFLYILIAIVIFISNFIIVKYNIASCIESRGNFYAYNSITVLAESIFLFLIFDNKKKKSNIFINLISSAQLDVYLISSHPLVLYWIWKQFYFHKNLMSFLLLAILSLTIQVICTIIGLVLNKIFIDKILNKQKYGK